jgi:hypothetical protein
MGYPSRVLRDFTDTEITLAFRSPFTILEKFVVPNLGTHQSDLWDNALRLISERFAATLSVKNT